MHPIMTTPSSDRHAAVMSLAGHFQSAPDIHQDRIARWAAGREIGPCLACSRGCRRVPPSQSVPAVGCDEGALGDPDALEHNAGGMGSYRRCDAPNVRSSAGHQAGHQIACQQRLLRLELVSQLVMIASSRTLCGHRLTCTNKPKITNYSSCN
jgi:hypothetical protein